jgi:signal transduction histidine kinase
VPGVDAYDRAMEPEPARQALLQAVVAVGADLELSEVLDRIVESACALVGARYGALGVLAPDGKHLMTFITQGVSEEERARIGESPHGHGVLGLLIRDPRPLRLSDVHEHPESFGFPAHHPPMRSFLGTPIKIRDELFGNLYLTDKQGADEFTDEDEGMVVALAAAAGVAIDNARLYDRSQRQRRWSEAVSDLTQRLLESEEEDAALEVMATDACRLSRASFAAVALYDEDEDLVVRAVHQDGAPTSGARSEQDGRNAIGTVLAGSHWVGVKQARQPLLLLSDPDDGAARGIAAEARALGDVEPAGPTALLPIALGRGDLGALILAWDADLATVADEMMTAAADFAQQAGLALVAARAQRDRSRMTLLEDRDRIARDMHDHVIQRLFATGLSLQSAARVATHPLVRNRLDDAVDELDASIRHIRQTIFELHRPIPTGGVRSEVEGLLDTFSDTLGYDPDLVIEGRLAGLSTALETDLLAVVREALSNVARHAHADRVAVRLGIGEDVVVEVRDDGVGIDPGAARSGLVNLGTRAAARSGTFRIARAPAGGTVLSWRVPREDR